MSHVVRFDDERAVEHDLVGGKGANLALLSQAGFRVPPGFAITTDAYSAFLTSSGVDARIESALGGLTGGDGGQLESATAAIRGAITSADMPVGLAGEIAEAYRSLGADTFVAVRSSGTAEDLAGASFAGLHDTYLDVRGVDDVLDAVRRCWASLWNARAAAYRGDKGFDQRSVRIAVVVQAMVESDVAGVTFTANPLTMATDEMVVNASWGLGEAIVSGIVTPDQYTVKAGSLRVMETELGPKTIRIRRDPDAGGTVTEDVPEPEQGVACLDEEQLAAVVTLGRDVQAYYGDFPQDIEWAWVNSPDRGIGGDLYLLQSRPITGVDFSWDADVDALAWNIADDDNAIWTRLWAEELTTGAVTPLTYSVRYPGYATHACTETARSMNMPELQRVRLFKYYKGEVYYNTGWEKIFIEKGGLPFLRPMMLAYTAPPDREAILSAPFDYASYLNFLLRGVLHPTKGAFSGIKRIEQWQIERRQDTRGLSAEQISRLSDVEVMAYIANQQNWELQCNLEYIPGLFVHFRDALAMLAHLLGKWYPEADPGVFAELLSGSRERSDTQKENIGLFDFSERIRNTPVLLDAFRNHRDGDFFAELENTPEGRGFLADYRRWADLYAHRGEAERDMLYPRRCEDPSLDYRAFEGFLKAEDLNPIASEEATNKRREATFQRTYQAIKGKPLGWAKAEVFRYLYEFCHKWIVARDNERQSPTDLIQMSYKRGFVDIGRRMHERGQLAEPDDYHYLSWQELYDLFKSKGPASPLIQKKIETRKRDVERVENDGIDHLPKYLRRNRPVVLEDDAAVGVDGRFTGFPTSSGVVTGTARVVRKLADTSRIQPGDILVTHATDPGWTPVFLLLKGLVFETGGLLSHGSCVAREYGLPAVALKTAMQLIPDGATITVDGNSGTVTIVDQPSTEASEPSDTSAQMPAQTS